MDFTCQQNVLAVSRVGKPKKPEQRSFYRNPSPLSERGSVKNRLPLPIEGLSKFAQLYGITMLFPMSNKKVSTPSTHWPPDQEMLQENEQEKQERLKRKRELHNPWLEACVKRQNYWRDWSTKLVITLWISRQVVTDHQSLGQCCKI